MEGYNMLCTEKGTIMRGDTILSPKELVHLHQSQTVIPTRGPKEQHPDGSQRQESEVERRRVQRQALLRTHRVAKLGSLSVGEWEPNKELVVVKSHKGRFWHTMGYMMQGQKYLYPEEGLFLLEVGSLDLHYGGISLSIQMAYSLLIPTYVAMERYRVYCQLMRLGYITTRHIECDITDYEYRLRMHQYRHTQKLAYHKVHGWFQQLGDAPMNSIQPDGDVTLGTLSSDGHHSRRCCHKMSASNSNLNTHNSVEQSGCDSSEVGSAGEMTRVLKARQKGHRAGGKSSRQGGDDRLKPIPTPKSGGPFSDNRLDQGADKLFQDVAPDESGKLSTVDKSVKSEIVELREKVSEINRPMVTGTSDRGMKVAKCDGDESSEYSDGPVYPEDKAPEKSVAFDETSISLLDLHKRRLYGNSDGFSSNNKRLKTSGSESDSSRERRRPKPPSPLAAHQPLPDTRVQIMKSTTLDDSGKDTHSDVDLYPRQTSNRLRNLTDESRVTRVHERLRGGKRRSKQGTDLGLKQGMDKNAESPSSDLGPSDEASSMSVDLEEFLDMVIPMLQDTHTPSEDNIQVVQTNLDYPQWNFDKINLPDIASNVTPTHLPFPAKALVPANIAAGRCLYELATVKGKQMELGKLANNSKMLLAKSKKMISVLELRGEDKTLEKDQPLKNASRENTSEPNNWKEYKEKRHQDEQNMTELLNCPASHLWKGDVKPLVKPADAKSTGHVLNKLQVIDGASLVCEHSGHRVSPPLIDSRITFDVFLPDKKYKKTNPGQPSFCVVTCSEVDPVPELAAQIDLLLKADPVPVIWGVVDSTDVNFYTLADIELPTDITMG